MTDRPTSEAPSLTIPTDRIDAALTFYAPESALSSCMDLRPVDCGLAFVLRRPLSMLSDGEQLLWAALVSVVAGYTLDAEDWQALEAKVDATNLAIVREAVAA